MTATNGAKPKSVMELPGIGPATAEKLRTSGFADIMSIAVASPSELMEAAEIGESVAQRISETARGSGRGWLRDRGRGVSSSAADRTHHDGQQIAQRTPGRRLGDSSHHRDGG